MPDPAEPAPERTSPEDTTESTRHCCPSCDPHAFVDGSATVIGGRRLGTAPVTAEGLSERVAAAIEARVKASVRPERPPNDGSVGLAHFVGASFRDLADVALAALAGDPGDLPARMAEAMRAHYIPINSSGCVCGHWADGVMGPDWDEHLAEAAAGVRDEQLAHETARAEHAAGQLSALRDHRARWETEKARADEAEAKLERMDAKASDHIGDLIRQRDEALTERDVLKAAIEPMRQHLAKIAHFAEFSPETKVGELLPLVKRLIAILDGAHSPADASTAVTAATEADAARWAADLANASLHAYRAKYPETDR